MKIIGLVTLVLALVLSTGLGVRASEDLSIDIVVSPNVLNLESDGIWVTVHAVIPYSVVVKSEVYLNGIPVEVTKSDSRGELVAKFLLDDVRGLVRPGTNDLTLTGVTASGQTFSGTDTILVIQQTGKR
jgi:hypothetical protein